MLKLTSELGDVIADPFSGETLVHETRILIFETWGVRKPIEAYAVASDG
jgi:hypothetical protein